MTSIQKLALLVAAIDIQDDEEIVIIADDDEDSLTEDEFGNLFQDTS